MTRSYRRTPIFGITDAKSEKQCKRKANRRVRHAVKMALYLGKDPLPHLREKSNVWGFAKDGRRYLQLEDRERFPEWKRK